ncbi:cache domain-containing sensor histidine kinase [Pseudobutyrivibrio sp. MD2005]|uniref:cache domain-containing sensor histidine kinase n=1 Tax=Pseudobutyrivibrio sp. MD2005 TaxID=1410616 RepID=UPI000486CC30|nr:sensor histidine kinase [Pseudobutyrivibrio sp. MD2005]
MSKGKISLRKRILYVFLIVAIMSSAALGFFSYNNIAYALKETAEKNSDNTLLQVDNNINILLDSYEDVLYQIYTNDDVIAYVDSINEDNNKSVAKNSLRRYLRALVNSKDYIRSITVIANNGEIIAYDQMTNKTYENGWLDNYSMDGKELYSETSQNALLHIFPPEYGTTFANEEYYLLHLTHRFVDYKDIRRDVGIVIISVDEKMIQGTCATDEESGSFIFIADNDGRITSCGKHQELIGTTIKEVSKDGFSNFAAEHLGMDNFDTYYYTDEALGWNIVYIYNRENLTKALHYQLKLILVIEVIIFLSISLIIISMTERLASSVDKVVKGMKQAQTANSNVSVEIDNSMPLEIETIALGFNEMIEKLEAASASERKALVKQKEAQIAALEAQINPHFLYNTLDTINWLAIDKDEYEISNAIGALASILRYAISDSNAAVKMSDEIEWLKKYIYLQQVRLKNKFSCNIDVAMDANDVMIHKLLLQPFVENAIIHGFEDNQSICSLSIIAKLEEQLIIIIEDNGKGMSGDIVERFNSMDILQDDNKHHIGMANAITRLNMYYGDQGKVQIESKLGAGTKVTIRVPITK